MELPIGQVICADCLDFMRTLPNGCVDAVITDPPYGLSDPKRRQSPFEVMANIVLPQYGDWYSSRLSGGELPQPSGSITHLDWVSRAIGEESRVSMPERPIDLNGDTQAGEHEVKYTDELTAGIAQRGLSNELNPGGGQSLSDFILNLRPARDAALCNSRAGSMRQLGAGRFAMPIVIFAASRLHSFLASLDLRGAPLIGELVRSLNNAQAESGGAPAIHAGGRAEVRAVFAFDLRSGTAELAPAGGAAQDCAAFELCGPQAVATGAGAGSLPPELKPLTFSLIGCPTDGAITVHFHNAFLNSINYTRKGFMGKEWDGDVPSVELWREVYRVLKDGGRVFAFAGVRTDHRMCAAIEDAGFVLEDKILWLFGSGFPKHASKLKPAYEPIIIARKGSVSELQIDAGRIGTAQCGWGGKPNYNSFGGFSGEPGEPGEPGRWPANIILDPESAAALDQQSGTLTSGTGAVKRATSAGHQGNALGAESRPAGTAMVEYGDSGGASRFFKVCESDCPFCEGPKHGIMSVWQHVNNVDVPSSPARGGDSVGVFAPGSTQRRSADKPESSKSNALTAESALASIQATIPSSVLAPAQMRHSANLAPLVQSVGRLCGSCAIGIALSLVAMQRGLSPESVHGLDSISEHRRQILIQSLALFAASLPDTDTMPTIASLSLWYGYVRDAMQTSTPTAGMEGESAPARFLYQSKASASERNSGLSGMPYGEAPDCARKTAAEGRQSPLGQPRRNHHNTVKPLDLMRYLCKLAVKPGSTILDPFAGSGTTCIAAALEGMQYIGIEREPEYCDIARARIKHWTAQQGLPLEAL